MACSGADSPLDEGAGDYGLTVALQSRSSDELTDAWVMLLKDGQLAAYREATSAGTVTFTDGATVNGDRAESLKPGDYQIAVVANASDLQSTWDAIKSGWNSGQTITCSDLLGYKLTAGSDGLAPNQEPPLTWKQTVTVNPGHNSVTGQLKRAYARLRIEIENSNATGGENIQVLGLTFASGFTGKTQYLFADQSGTVTRGNITASSSNALVPFAACTVTPGERRAIFDAYLLESQNDGYYTYTLRLKAGSTTKSVPVTIETVNTSTGIAERITAINRNDFITSSVFVSYNPKAGDIEFEVEPWTQKDLDIEFN